jgi:hypothetical protein
MKIQKQNFAEWKWNFCGRSENKKGTMFSGGIDKYTEFLFLIMWNFCFMVVYMANLALPNM